MFCKEVLTASQSLIRSALVGTLLLSAGTLADTNETRSRTVTKPNKNAEMVAETSRTNAVAPTTPETAVRMSNASAIRSVKVTKDFNRGGLVMATIELDGHAKYSYFTLPSPYRLVVDVQNVVSDVPGVIQVGMADLKRVRLGKMDDAIRIVFDGAKPQPFEISDDGLVIRIWFGEPKATPVLAVNQAQTDQKPSQKINQLQPNATALNRSLSPAAKPTPAVAPAVTANVTNATPKVAVTAKNSTQLPVQSPTPVTTQTTNKTVGNLVSKPSVVANEAVSKPTLVELPTPLKYSHKAVKPRLTNSLFVRRFIPTSNALLAKNDDAPPPPKVTNKKAPVVAEPTRPAPPSAAQTASSGSGTEATSEVIRPLGKKGNTRVVSAKPMPITTPATTLSPAPAPTTTPAPVKATATEKVVPPTVPSTKAVAAATTTLNTTSAPAPAPPVARPREVVQTPANPQTKVFKAADYMRADFEGEPINLDLRSTAGKMIDIRDFLRFITDTYKVNFVMDQSVREIPITVTLQNVPWNHAMDALLRANRLGIKVEGNILRVMSQETVALEDRLKQEQIRARQEATPLITDIVKLNYAKAAGGVGGGGGASSGGGAGAGAGGGASLSGAGSTAGGSGLQGIINGRLSPRGKIEADPRTNTLIITDVPENVLAIKDLIAKLDVPEPQVEIESRIVIANRNFARDLGVQLGATALNTGTGARGTITTLPDTNLPPAAGGTVPGGTIGAAGPNSVLSLTTGLLGTARISAVLSAAESKGNVKTISSPRITALNNQTANIVNGVQIPVQTESNNTLTVTFVTAALRLEITPQINEAGNVLLRVVAENNSVNTAIATRSAPGINTQRAETTVLVPDGGTTIIGGINIDVESNSQQRTPGVSRIPGLGELFKRRTVSRQTDEILFFITPRVYRPLDTPKMTTGTK